MTTHHLAFAKKPLNNAIMVIILSSTYLSAMAEEQNNIVPQAELETIVTVGSATTEAENKDITGLGQIKKTAETLKQQQIESIRDLTRYDAGVAINESVGRGTSTGFSIRGAEKERVAVMVDGLGQGETIKLYGNGSGVESGAKNEAEYENLKLVEINKGVNSTYAGSGALGGAVLMQTKDASDFISDGKDFGGRVKLGYTSKDQRKVASVGLGGRKNGWEGFIQYTKRKGHEIKPHKEIYDLPPTAVDNVITGIHDNKIYEIDFKDRQNKKDSYNRLTTLSTQINDETVNFSTNDISGPDRRVPNPMDYDSSSILSKVGYHFNQEHYVGGVFEDTKQTYDVRNMFNYQYNKSNLADSLNNDKSKNNPMRTGQITSIDKFPDTTPIIADFFKHTPTSFYTDIHHNQRQGLEYKYTPTENTFVDELNANLDRQKLSISSNNDFLNCAKWPNVDRNCDVTQAGHYTHKKEDERRFDTKRLQLKAKKNFKIANTSHDFSITTGYKNTVYDGDITERKKAISRFLDKKNIQHNVTKDKAYVYDAINNTYSIENNVTINEYKPLKTISVSEENLYPLEHDIKHQGYHIGFNDNINLTDKLGMTLGLRYDNNKFESDLSNVTVNTQYTGNKDTPKFSNSNFKNTSYNLGLSYFPIRDLELTYKFSTGFRVPSFGEQLGITGGIQSQEVQPPIKAETAKNHEIGATYYTDFGVIKGNYFRTNYDDFIDIGEYKVDDKSVYGYLNYQDVKVHGFDISSELDLNALWNKIPLGLQANASASMVKMRDRNSLESLGDNYNYVRSYAFDMVQPLRLIYGLSYHEPNDKWSVSLNTTYSAKKEPNENDQERKTGLLGGNKATNSLISPSWRVTDLTGHYNINDNITLRGGIYNLFNYRYLTWESLRQNDNLKEETGVDEVKLLAAPGRNYGLSMEFVF